LYNKLEPLIGEPGFQPLDEQIHTKLIGLEISKTYPNLGELISQKGLVAAINETIPSSDQENVYKIILAILNVIQKEYERSISGGRRRAKSRRRGSKSKKQTKRSKRRRSV
jgi:hypothetical protein